MHGISNPRLFAAAVLAMQGAAPQPVREPKAMVSSASAPATDAGVSILKQGGNAVDAAIAVAFALAVTYPTAGNIGGGGFMVVRMADGRTAAIDSRETAPAAAHKAMLLDAQGNVIPGAPKTGHRSAGVPGTVAGMALALEKFGRLKWAGAPNQFGFPAGENNTIAPGKRPISPQTPAIAARDGKLAFVLGTPGGTTIPNTVLQVVLNLIDHGMNIQEAVDAPRIHHQWLPDVIRYEKYGLAADVVRALEQRGHKLEVNGIGMVHAVQIEPSAGVRLGASDSRSADGKSAGY